MTTARSLSDVISSGVEIQAHEAAAIVQALIACIADEVELVEPLGPPSLENVQIDGAGAVRCRACAATPAVYELGILLESMLPRGGPVRAPGALRYAIARALLEVDAPPFDSLAELSATLARHEQGDRVEAVRALFVRSYASHGRLVAFPGDRRKRGSSATELRRHLRAVDEELFLRRATDADAAALMPPSFVLDSPCSEQPCFEQTPLARPSFEQRFFEQPSFEQPLFEHAGARSRGRAGLAVWLTGGSAAALVSLGLGYGTVSRLQHRAFAPALTSAARPDAPRPAASPVEIAGVSTLNAEATVVPPAPTPLPRDPRVGRRAEGMQPDVIHAVARADEEATPPALESSETPTFSASKTSVGTSPSDLNDGFGVMTIVDDRARNYHATPSPDGTRVAFDSDRDGERGVYLANRDGTGVHRISGDGYAALPSWSPDGAQLAFVRAETDRPHVWNLWLTTLSDGTTRRLTSFRTGRTWGASWFGDGRRVAYTRDDRLTILDIESGEVREFASPIRGRGLHAAAVSPDGQHAIFHVAASGAWLIDLIDGTMRCVLTDPTVEDFAWSPDGRRVAYRSHRDGQWGIWVMQPAA